MRELSRADILAVERELCKRSLATFAKRAWHILEPSTPLKWGWALDAICAHLEAVTDGRINRLLMNVPPGTMKSLLTAVIWPAWEWGPRGLRSHRFISTAHKQDLAVRDNMKCRRLIQSEWYQDRWPLALTSDQNAKTKFENDATGFREAMAFASMTGARGDRVILDDPLSADDANSPAALLAAERTFLEALPTRVNNETSAIVVIMQRLHESDTAGLILSRKLPYTHLCLPMRFEAERRCETGIGFVDPRTVDGELLFPDRFSEEQVAELERTLGSYATAGQLQQRPTAREGGLFKRQWFEGRFIRTAPQGTVWVRHWDLAATKKATAARTAGVKLGKTPDGRYVVGHVVKTQDEGHEVRKLIKATAEADGRFVEISLPQDPGQAGKVQKSDMIAMLAGWVVRAEPETGDKETRALPFAVQCEAGNVDLVEGEWNQDFIDELCLFPGGTFKDQVDATSGAFGRLVTRSMGMAPVFATYGSGR
jgi:predicted phage terminase large subunit-like protein